MLNVLATVVNYTSFDIKVNLLWYLYFTQKKTTMVLISHCSLLVSIIRVGLLGQAIITYTQKKAKT